MKQNGLIASMIIVVLLLFVSCATKPAPIQGSVNIPQSFESVWYRATIARSGFIVYSDSGDFIVNNDSLNFQGKKNKIEIKLSEVKSISFGKIGSDFINNWVTIEYGEERNPLYAVISAGESMGWSGGTDTIYSTIIYSINKNDFSSIKIK